MTRALISLCTAPVRGRIAEYGPRLSAREAWHAALDVKGAGHPNQVEHVGARHDAQGRTRRVGGRDDAHDIAFVRARDDREIHGEHAVVACVDPYDERVVRAVWKSRVGRLCIARCVHCAS